MLPDQAAESRAQLRLRYGLAAVVADGHAGAGFTAVVQDVILGRELAEFADRIRTRPRYVVALVPTPRALTGRDDRRSKTCYGDWTAAELDIWLRNDTPRLGLWLDNSDLTPAETVAAILDACPTPRSTKRRRARPSPCRRGRGVRRSGVYGSHSGSDRLQP